jgi:DNA-binding transcriptional LysR family regulator
MRMVRREVSTVDWEDVRYFLRAAQARTLSGAARALGVEHTTVGRRLSALESALGAPLVRRGPAGLDLTPLGERVLATALQMERLAASIGELAVAERTNVRLVVPTGFTALLTPELESLHRAEPRVSLEIVSGGRHVDLRKGDADLAIRVGPIDDQQLVARKVGEVVSALYAARSYLARHPEPIDPDHLGGHSIIGFHASVAAIPSAQWLAERSAGARVVLRSREAMDMLTAAQTGAGLAVLPCFLGDGDATLVRLTRAPIATRGVSLVYRREARLSPEVRAVIAFVVEALRKQAARLRGRPARAAARG